MEEVFYEEKCGRIISLLLSAALFLSMFPMLSALAADDAVVLDVGQGRIIVYSDGYVIENSAKVSYTGDYILTGSGDREVYFNSPEDGGSDSYNVTLRNLTMDSAPSRSAINAGNGVTLNITVEGSNTVIADNHPGIQLLSGTGAAVNITMTENSRLELDCMSSPIRSINENIDAVVTNPEGVSGLGNLSNRSVALALGTGTLHDHECDSYSAAENGHSGICAICGETINEEHNFSYDEIDDSQHKKICEACGYEIAQAHEVVWEYWEDEHYGYCDLCFWESDSYEHAWDEGVDIPGTDAYVPAVKYTCTICGCVRLEEDGANAIEIAMSDYFGDSWDGAKLMVYRDGVLIRELEMSYDYEQETIYLPYSEDAGYVFVWRKGYCDDECGLTITLPGQEEPAYSQTDFYDKANGEVIFSINMADYTRLEEVMAEMPENLEAYTLESVLGLYELVSDIDWYLGKGQQETVNGYVSAIEAAVEALELGDGTPNGLIHINNGGLIITETGYYRGADDNETAYTGPYYIIGDTDEYGVIVESGSHQITLNGLSIYSYYYSSFAILEGAEVEMIIKGQNRLEASYYVAGLNVPEGAKLHILEESTGSLYALGGDDGAGIGGNHEEAAGVIIIDGGDITALSSGDGAGIGGGWEGGAGEIVINGGNIYAECLDDDGAGIGSGDCGQGGSITINGGNVTALSMGDAGAGIGAGSDGDEEEYGYVDEIIINGGVITAGSNDGTAIGGGKDYSPCGNITINGGIIIISSQHMNGCLIGSQAYSQEADGNRVIINGGNIISDNYSLAEGVSPLPKNTQGQNVAPYTFEIDEQLADATVTITLPDGSSRQETAYGLKLTVFLPAGLNKEEITLSYEKADYSAVESALEKVPEDLSIYTAESAAALKEAVDSVQWNLDIRYQAEVDEMAQAILDAIANLQIMDNSGGTGDSGSLVLWIMLCALIAAGIASVPVCRKLKGSRK